MMRHLGRKLYHLFGGLGLLALYELAGRESSLVILPALLAAVIALELLRLNVPPVNEFIFKRFPGFIRTSERERFTGSTPYLVGAGLSLVAFSEPIGYYAVCFLAFGDVAATTAGERFGRTRIGSKTLEGTASFGVASLAAGMLLSVVGYPMGYAIIIAGAVTAAGVELAPLPVNDNLSVPLLSGAVMELLLRASG